MLQINPISIYPIEIPREEVIVGGLSDFTKSKVNDILFQYLEMDDDTIFDIRDNNMESYTGEVSAADKVFILPLIQNL